MTLLVVSAHFDHFKVLREHVRQTLQSYAECADRVVVVSTSGLDDESIAQLPEGVEFVERRNFGYDFFSYKWGLDYVGDYAEYDQVLIVNDSFVGPVLPLSQIIESTQADEADLMGMTLSHRHGVHAQSFFMLANRYVTRSKSFRSYWKDMVPVSDRMEVIRRYEVGFSQTILEAGFSLGSYFQPTPEEEGLAAARYQWHTEHRLDKKDPRRTVAEVRSPDLQAKDLRTKSWNPASAYADRILLGQRLPLLKFDTLRFDPYSLGAANLLARCVSQMPQYFASVPNFLLETADKYPVRPGEVNRPVTLQELRSSKIGYGFDPSFATKTKEVA